MTRKSLARRLLFLGAALLGALSVYIASKTEFDSDLLSVLPKDLPEVKGIKHYRSLILDRTDFLVVLKGEDPVEVEESAQAFFNEMMIQMPELAGRIAWKSPWDHPAELGDLTAYSRTFEDPESFAEFTRMVTDPETAQEKIDETFTELSAEFDPEAGKLGLIDPLGFKRPDLNISALSGIGFSTRDGKMRIITVDVPPEAGNIPELRKWDERIADLIGSWKEKPNTISIHRTGRAAYMVELEIGMKWELLGSLSFTAFAVLLLFFIFYGRLRPLFSLAIALCLTFLVTFAIAGLLYKELGILSVGFAAILIGLVVDYGVVVYQEMQVSKVGLRGTVKLLLAPIFWAALTSGGVFLFLVRSAIPGIAQLGILVAIGVILGAVVMLLIFTPLAAATRAKRHGGEGGLAVLPFGFAKLAALVVVGSSMVVLGIYGFPKVISDPETLRPTRNTAGEHYNEITDRFEQNEIGRRRLIIPGESEAEVAATLRQADDWAKKELPKHTKLLLPTALWPDPDRAKINRENVEKIVASSDKIRAVLGENFTEDAEALEFFDETIIYFKKFLAAPSGEVPAPKNYLSKAILDNLISRDPNNICALGVFSPDDKQRETDTYMEALRKDVPQVLSAGWEHLTPQIKRLFAADLATVVLPIAGVLVFLLLLVFRRPVPVALSLVTLILSVTWLLATMRLIGVNWNLFNLMAVPLLLGLGLDYSIHMNLAAARAAAGDIGADRRVARALLVCSLSSAAGFASLVFSQHPGLSSLGIICSVGIILTMATAVFIVPGLAPPRKPECE